MKAVSKLKTPITYYGGKQSMAQHILPLIPPHKQYVEPFFGGGAIFFAKEQSEAEVINDLNGEIVNFYKIVCTDFWRLNEMIQSTLHSRQQYEEAMVVYKHPSMFDPVKRAWSFWILTQQGFVSKIGSWGYDKGTNRMTRAVINKKLAFDQKIRFRIEHATIECNDAVQVILSRDTDETFFYVDSPYIDTNQGHYSGYTQEDFKTLLTTLKSVRGKFLGSHYKSDILSDFVKKNNWFYLEIEKHLSASSSGKKKTEVLFANYDITSKVLQ
jgi:DNA adenine methylase